MCFAHEKRTEPLGYEPNVLTTTLSSQNNFKLEKLRSELNAYWLNSWPGLYFYTGLHLPYINERLLYMVENQINFN